MRGQSREPDLALAEYICEIWLANPWVRPDICSVVCLSGGKVIGSLGVVPRPMLFAGREITVATLNEFMVDPEHRRSPAALQLLKHCFKGPQDMTWADGASDPVHVFHRLCGSLPANFYSLHWMRLLRPMGYGRSFLPRFGGAGKALHALAPFFTAPVDSLANRAAKLRPHLVGYTWSQVSPDEMFDCIQEIGWKESLKPSYDRQSFAWLCAQTAKAPSGDFRCVIVHDNTGAKCGWFCYFAPPGGAGWLLQLGAKRPDQFDAVLKTVFADAWDHGCVAIKGSSRPDQLTTLTANKCIFRHPGSAALVHSRDPEIMNTVRLGEAALSGLDGERWLRFSADVW